MSEEQLTKSLKPQTEAEWLEIERGATVSDDQKPAVTDTDENAGTPRAVK